MLLTRMADRGHKYVSEKKGVTLHLKNEKTLFGPSVEKLKYFSRIRRPLDSSRFGLATIAPGKIPSVSPVNINTFHMFHGHMHEKLLRYERDSRYTRAQQRGYSREFAMSTPLATSAEVNTSGDTISLGASLELSPSVSEEDEVVASPSPKLGGRAAHELRWLGETPVVRQGQSRGEQRQFDLDSAALFVKEALATEELQEWL